MTVIIDTGLANIFSVSAALARLGVDAKVSADENDVRSSSRVIFPGVGAAAPAMKKITELGLDRLLPSLTQPVLGICLGMQLLFQSSQEGGVTPCIGILPGDITLMSAEPGKPVPHMGWNRINFAQNNSPLFQDIENGSHMYFVHSYAAKISGATLASTDYGGAFSSVIGFRNFYGCQFHPERSGTAGQKFLQNFLAL